MGHGSGFRGPLRYRNSGHHLDEAPLELVNKLTLVSGDTEHTRVQGYATDFAGDPFLEVTSASTAAVGSGWQFDASGAGGTLVHLATAAGTQTYGIVRMTTAALATDHAQLQQESAAYRYTSGKRLWFCTRVALEDANDTVALIGLTVSGTTDAVGSTPSDGIWFEKAATDTTWTGTARKNTTSDSTTGLTGTIADDTMQELAISVDDAGNVFFYINGTLVKTVASGDAQIPDDEDLKVVYSIEAGAVAATKYIDIDSLLVGQER